MLGRADRLAAAGEYHAAHELYVKAAQQQLPGAHERLCHTVALLQRDVLACTADALRQNPRSAFLHMLDGQEALTRGHSQRAATSYSHAIELTPQPDADTLVNYGIALTAAGRPSAAVEWLQKATKLAPRSIGAATELARALEAATFPGADEALQARSRAAHLAPSSAEHHLDLGHALLAAQRPAEAANAMQRALHHTPSVTLEALARFGLGRAALAGGDACR